MKETDRRKRFFQTALQLIKEKGFKAMSMQDLADHLGCHKTNIYNYVKSKQDLLDTLLFEISNKFHEGIADIETSAYPPMEKLKAVVALHVRITVAHPYQVALLVHEWRHLKPERQQEFLEFRNTYEQKLQSILKEGIQEGILDIDNLEFTTNCMLSSIRWLYSWYNPNDPSVNPIELERLMTGFVLNGVGAKMAVKL